MPHIIVEYSDDLSVEPQSLIKGLHDSLAAQDTVTHAAITARATPIKYCSVGEDEHPNSFVHILVKLLPGRSDELRAKMTKGLQETARSHITDSSVNISVETIELHQASYIK